VLGPDREDQGSEGVVSGPVIEVVKVVSSSHRPPRFLPASSWSSAGCATSNRTWVRPRAKIIELDKNRNNVVLSRRAWLEETQKEQRDEFLTNLKPGERRVVWCRRWSTSCVRRSRRHGRPGPPCAELSWKHVDHPGSVVAVGDEIEVEVLEVDMSRERISLSLKATQQDPWRSFASNHQVGELVYGVSPSWCRSARSSRWATHRRPRAHLGDVGDTRRPP